MKRQRRQNYEGQSLVELALLLPLIGLLLLGAVDLGRAYFAYVRLTNAVEQGAMFGTRYPQYWQIGSMPNSTNPNNIRYWVMQELADSSGASDPALTMTISASSSSDIVCYAGVSDTLLATGSFAGDCSKARIGDTIQVRATYNFQPLTMQMAGIVGRPLQLHRTARMVIQNVSPF